MVFGVVQAKLIFVDNLDSQWCNDSKAKLVKNLDSLLCNEGKTKFC